MQFGPFERQKIFYGKQSFQIWTFFLIQDEFYGRSFKKRSLITGGGGGGSGGNTSFSSASASASTSGGGDMMQLYKVLQDRDGDYSYAYDTSLSPAFIIK